MLTRRISLVGPLEGRRTFHTAGYPLAPEEMLPAPDVLLLSPLVGARFSVAGALLSLAVLAMFGMAVNALGIAIAAGMKTFEGFGGVVNFLIQPIFFLSGALDPLDGLPQALRILVVLNPMSYAVDAVRGLLIGVHHFPLALSVGVVLGTTVVLSVVAVIRFRRMEA